MVFRVPTTDTTFWVNTEEKKLGKFGFASFEMCDFESDDFFFYRSVLHLPSLRCYNFFFVYSCIVIHDTLLSAKKFTFEDFPQIKIFCNFNLF